VARVDRPHGRGGLPVRVGDAAAVREGPYLWSRLLLAALALVPVAQFWWLFIEEDASEPGWLWLNRADWLLGTPAQSGLAVLAGVAIASGFNVARVSAGRGVAASRLQRHSRTLDVDREDVEFGQLVTGP
jgi:hypothetical protein